MSGDKNVMASKQFVADFAVVATHYSLAELGQIEEAKAAARRDMPGATVYFARMAGVVRHG